jgi:LTXXQ motif family protein
MNKLGTGLLAACMALAFAATPALAQQGGPGGGMMGKGPGQGQSMMDKGGPGQGGGMMGGAGQGRGMMQGGMMGGPGGMMGKANCPRMGGMMGGGMMGKGMMHSRPMMEARLAYIKADLEITDAQMDAWNAYADAVRKRHDSMVGVRADMMKAKSGNAVERLDARIKATEAKLESLKALNPATEGLYNVLADEQKKKADELLGGTCGMM